ncbi:MAG: hypothetical protein M1830_001021 [Pleopsidium flavum]|nr:MAG: hypothetical protein M1830_001021 [Pleopsidium flavum]
MKRTLSTAGDTIRQAPGKRTRTSNDTHTNVVDGFPRWMKGTVWIHISDNPKYQYQLHKAVLERTSTWFLEELRKNIDESGKVAVEAPKEGVKFNFVLECSGNDHEPLLALETKGNAAAGIGPRRVNIVPMSPNATQDSSHGQFSSTGTIDLSSPGPEVPPAVKAEQKEEPNQPSKELDDLSLLKAALAEQKAEERSNRCVTAHNNLFRIYYNHTPDISTTNIDTALDQCEALVKVAEMYGSLYVVRPYLGNICSQYRHTLFVAIWKDPPRWLNLSIPLQSASIFSEALIHLAGCWPKWPWPTSLQTISPEVLQLVTAKAKTLCDLRSNVDREILQNTIAQNDRHVTLTESYETWFVVQLFRDWFLDRQNLYRKIGKPHYGTFYRLMRKGGDSYLPADKQLEMLMGLDRGRLGMWEEVGEDLKLLKEFAQGAVVQLCKNGLMLDVEEAGIQYLTCLDVGAEDFPWMKQGGDDES